MRQWDNACRCRYRGDFVNERTGLCVWCGGAAGDSGRAAAQRADVWQGAVIVALICALIVLSAVWPA